MLRLAFPLVLVACTTEPPPDYGAPSASTRISIDETGGFAGGTTGRGVDIEGSSVTYRRDATTETRLITVFQVEALIASFEDVAFLDMPVDLTQCQYATSQAPTARIAAALAPGAHEVRYYVGCNGGAYSDASALREAIFDKSGWNDWVGNQP